MLRSIIRQDPFLTLHDRSTWIDRGIWPCSWISVDPQLQPPFVAAYKLEFECASDTTICMHVSADERYELFLDGIRIGRGSERGDVNHWLYETYDIPVSSGSHTLAARTWALGKLAPYAQMTIKPGFILAAEGDWLNRLSTGLAPWKGKILGGYKFLDFPQVWGTGCKIEIDGAAIDFEVEKGGGEGWQDVHKLHPGSHGPTRNEVAPSQMMQPGTLPLMLEEHVATGRVRAVHRVSSPEPRTEPVSEAALSEEDAAAWNLTNGGGPVTVPPSTRIRAIIDLEDYYCAYPEVTMSGGNGGKVRLSWAEALYEQTEGWTKGNRDEIEGKYFVGIWDIFCSHGTQEQRTYTTLWWQAGRYLEALVETADEPLTLHAIEIRQTHYPFDYGYKFTASDNRLHESIPIMQRVLEMCSHETYMDCPYYEQLQYVGDTRLEALTTYCVTADDRLPKKAVNIFNASRRLNGLTQSRYPSRVTQVIPPFSLWWIGMVYDYALWRQDEVFVRQMMPGVRGVIDYFNSVRNGDGLVEAPNGWNYMDWVPGWSAGSPEDGQWGVSGIINWQYALISGLAADLEEHLGETELATRNRRIAAEVADALHHLFFDNNRGIFADDLKKSSYSEHIQCLAILSRLLPPDIEASCAEGLLTQAGLHQTTIYFSHYLFETYRLIGAMDQLFERLEMWYELPSYGFRTTLESPEPSRSDCHAWGAHPIYHYFASILGIRPGEFGFRSVTIEPQLGPLEWAKGALPHPTGEIAVDLQKSGEALAGTVSLPDGIEGVLRYEGRTMPLTSGEQEIQWGCYPG